MARPRALREVVGQLRPPAEAVRPVVERLVPARVEAVRQAAAHQARVRVVVAAEAAGFS